VGTVLLPELSQRLQAQDDAGGRAALSRAAEFALALTIPAAVALTRLVWLVGRQALPPQTGDWLDACAERPGYGGNVYVEE
ncbi:MAG: hypothetical protein AAFV49_21285, partial [Pseudomonadota bacterium]